MTTAAHQQVTDHWWQDRRQQFDLYVSESVIQEAGAGDPNEAQKRLDGRRIMRDPIVDEIRKARQMHAEKFNYDLDAIYQDLKTKEQQSRRKVVSLPPKRPKRRAAS